MNLARILLGQPMMDRYRQRRRAAVEALEREAAELEAAKNMERNRQSINRFPVQKFTKAEFESLPKLDTLALKTCPLGTWFVCVPWEHMPDIVVVGHVVKGLDAILGQYGSGTDIPERFINRYRVELV